MLKMFVMWENLKYHLQNEKGQGMVEYGLILVLVSLVAIIGLTTVGTQLDTLFDSITTKLTPAAS